MAAAQFITVLAGLIGVLALGVYLFGIPPELKRKLERSALKTMGENKLSYMAKDQISKVPASDQEDVNQLKKGLGNAVGGLTKNPLGEATGRVASQAWDSVEDFSKILLDRVATMAKNAKEAAAKKAGEGEESRPVQKARDTAEGYSTAQE